MRRYFPVFAAAGLTACATVQRASPPSSLEQGMLIARVQAHGALFHRYASSADSAKIIALDSQGVPVPGAVAVSGIAVNGYVIFLDMPAGRYVLRTASFPARGVRYQLIAPQDAESKRAVLLRPGAAAYLGDHGFDSRFPDFDVALGRAARIIGHWLTPFLRRPTLPRDADMRAFDAGPVGEASALLAVREALAATPWRRVVDARLRELGAAAPAKMEGVLRSREIALHEEAFLSWRDTLKWGEPRRAAAGLAWRRPGGAAQVAVFFTTSSAPGFAGWDAAVAELRRAASASVEDRGGLYEVRVATRAGVAARTTKYQYPEGVLVGSETAVVLTETTLVPDGYGVYTARLRAPRGEFDAALPAYREFLLQLVLGPPKPKPAAKQETAIPFLGGPP